MNRLLSEVPIAGLLIVASWLMTPPGCAVGLTGLTLWVWLDPLARRWLYREAQAKPQAPPQVQPDRADRRRSDRLLAGVVDDGGHKLHQETASTEPAEH